jgi:hypothetical protein
MDEKTGTTRRRFLAAGALGSLAVTAGCNAADDSGSSGPVPPTDSEVTHVFVSYENQDGRGLSAKLALRFADPVSTDGSGIADNLVLPTRGTIEQTPVSVDLRLREDPGVDVTDPELSGDAAYNPGDYPHPINTETCEGASDEDASNATARDSRYPDERVFDTSESEHLVGFELAEMGGTTLGGRQVVTKSFEITGLGTPEFVLVGMPDGFVYERSWEHLAAVNLVGRGDDFSVDDYVQVPNSRDDLRTVPGIEHTTSGLVASGAVLANEKFRALFPTYLAGLQAHTSLDEYRDETWASSKQVVADTVTEVAGYAGLGASGGTSVGKLAMEGSEALTAIGAQVWEARTELNQPERDSEGENIAQMLDDWGGYRSMWNQEVPPLMDYLVEDSNAHSFRGLLGDVLDEILDVETLARADTLAGTQESLGGWHEDVGSGEGVQESLSELHAAIDDDNNQMVSHTWNGMSSDGELTDTQCFVVEFYHQMDVVHAAVSRLNAVSKQLVAGAHPGMLQYDAAGHQSRRLSDLSTTEVESGGWADAYTDDPADANLVHYLGDGVLDVELDEDGLPSSRPGGDGEAEFRTASETLSAVHGEYGVESGGTGFWVYALDDGFPEVELWELTDRWGDESYSGSVFDGVAYVLSSSGDETEALTAYDVESQAELWQLAVEYDGRNGSYLTSPRGISAPVLHDGLLYVEASPGGVHVVDPDSQSVVGTGPEVAGTLYETANGPVSVGPDGVDKVADDGSTAWRRSLNVDTDVRPAVSDARTCVVSEDDQLAAIAASGSREWVVDLAESTLGDVTAASCTGAPVAVPDSDLVGDPVVLVPLAVGREGRWQGNGRVVGIDAAGELALELDTDTAVVAIHEADGWLYVLETNGDLGVWDVSN